MRFVKNHRLAVITSGVLVILIGLSTVWIVRYEHAQSKKKIVLSAQAKANKIVNQALQTAKTEDAKSDQQQEAAYNETAGITTVVAFEKKIPVAQRSSEVLLLLERLVAAKDFQDALVFVNYTQTNYPTVAASIDFEVLAYNVGAGLQRSDLMSLYKQQTQATLRAQGIIGPNDTVPDSYFSGAD